MKRVNADADNNRIYLDGFERRGAAIVSLGFLGSDKDDGKDYLFYQGNNIKGKSWYLSASPACLSA